MILLLHTSSVYTGLWVSLELYLNWLFSLYKCVEGTAPGYLIEMVVKCRNVRVLQSSTANKLLTSKNNLTQVQLSSFAMIGAIYLEQFTTQQYKCEFHHIFQETSQNTLFYTMLLLIIRSISSLSGNFNY